MANTTLTYRRDSINRKLTTERTKKPDKCKRSVSVLVGENSYSCGTSPEGNQETVDERICERGEFEAGKDRVVQ